MKNKKSIIVVSALVRIIIAVVVLFLVVIPACSKIRSLFVGGVGSGPYEELLKNVDEISRADGEAVTQLLKLDSGTAILVFPEGINEVVVHQIAGPPPGTTITFSKPDRCEGIYSCICLCKKIDESGGDVSCASDTPCQSFNFPVIGICKIDGPHNYKWECIEGVIIERGLKENKNSYLFLGSTSGSESNKIADISDHVLRIEKTAEGVAVCENPDPITRCVPQP